MGRELTKPAPAFATRLRTLRETRGLSVRALANQIGVSVLTMQNWENGRSTPRQRSRRRLTNFLGTDVFDNALFGAENGRLVPNLESRNIRPKEAESLAAVIDRAKQLVAAAAGTSVSNVTVRIAY